MRPVYKKIKVVKEHCPKCGEELSGNNSFVSPWECSCGVWEAEQKWPFRGEYIIKPNPLKNHD